MKTSNLILTAEDYWTIKAFLRLMRKNINEKEYSNSSYCRDVINEVFNYQNKELNNLWKNSAYGKGEWK